MLRNVLIVKLGKLYTVNLYVFLSALYMLRYVPIVTTLVIVYFSKKKKEKKSDPYFGMGKNATIPRYLSFLLGKGGNPYVSKPYIKTKYKCAFCPVPSMKKDSDSDKVWTTHVKIAQNVYIFSVNFAPFQ